MELQVGDVVRLKSSGPAMTIEKVGQAAVDCIWFCEMTKQLQRATLPPLVLKKLAMPRD